MEELKRYLVRLPQILGYREDRKIKVNVHKALYYAITGEGEYLDLLFLNISEDEKVALENYSWPPKLNRTLPFYKNRVDSRYTHPKGQTCGRILGENEPVYRCADCGYDDTCVMCVKCFNREDHADHNVSVYLSNGDSGGMCDCGDETAFTRKLNCACQAAEETTEELPDHFKLLIRATLEVVLNYILDVTNFSINTLPLIHKNINNRGDLRITSKHISDFGSLPMDVYGAEDENSDTIWYLVLWNDENHDYLEAETGIRAATGVTDEKAKLIASEINANGRAILKIASSYTELLKGQKLAEADGLVATIMTARDFMREEIVYQMFEWIADITSFSANSAFREISKAILAELLLEPDFEFSKILPAEFFQTKHLDIKKEFFRNGMLFNGELLNLGLTKLKPGVSTSSLTKTCHEIFRPAFDEKLVGSRIQYLFVFEIRFVSKARKQFSKVILPLFFSNATMKATFCEQYLQIFPAVLNILALSDREEQIASSTDVSVQLFTCPRTNKWIVSSGNLGNILGPLSELIEGYSSRVNTSGYPNLIDVVVDIRSKREKSALQKTITDTIDTFNRIVSKNDEMDILNQFLLHDNLVLLLNFQKYFQGSSAIVRKYGDHVERELLQDFYTFLQRSLPILKIVQNIAKVDNIDVKHAQLAIGLILEFLSMRKITYSAPGIAEFRVSKEAVSYTNPLNSFLSLVLQKCGINNAKSILQNTKVPFMCVSDFSLRSIVLASQVKIGLWIRNGVTVSRQASCYTDTVAELAYYRDLHLNQVACVFDVSRLTLINFLDRWELLQWYAGEQSEDKTIYEEKFSFICEQFILFLYNILTDRYFFDDDQSLERELERKKKGVCYALCTEPKAYSALKAELNVASEDAEQFDVILRECADYNPPTGLYDFGVYRLKPEIYQTLDPLNVHLDSSKFQSIAESLMSNIAKLKRVDERLVILKPEIQQCNSEFVNIHIGDFTRTKEFAKLVYKLLQVALSSQDELFLPHLLHLIHAVILDDELVNGSGHLADFFVTIPIGDLLLSIAESSMSNHIVLKADFILDEFVTRDSRIMESLVDCFGEDHVQAYKKRKFGLFETEAEKRKRMAEERKAKVMKKFAKQRERFMKRNDMDHDDMKVEHEEHNSKLRKCVTCGEYELTDELFGLLMCSTNCSVFWKMPPPTSLYAKLAFNDWDSRAPVEEGKVYLEGFPFKTLRDLDIELDGTVASSCAHGMHYKCYLRAQTQFKAFPCPLCHNFHDSFIPSFQSTDTCDLSEFITGNIPWRNEDEFASYGGPKVEELKHILISEGSISNDNLMDEFNEFMCKDDTKELHEIMHDLSLLISKTVEATEIATRLEGKTGLFNILVTIPNNTKALLRSLIQSRILIASFCERLDGEFTYENIMHDLSNLSWNSLHLINGCFNIMLAIFFQSDASFKYCVNNLYARKVALSALALYGNSNLAASPEVLTESQKMDVRNFFQRLADGQNGVLPANFTDEFLGQLYATLQRLLLPFLRQCLILLDLLTCKDLGHNEFKSILRLQNFQRDVADGDYSAAFDKICKILEVPNLLELFEGIAAGREEFKEYLTTMDRHFLAPQTSVLNWESIAIEYPGVVRLIELPDDYNDCITDPQYKLGTGMSSICLQCGQYIDTIHHVSHVKECSFMPIYFAPSTNHLHVVIELSDHPFEVKIPAPYLTIHGEVKKDRSPGKATLNQLRYQHLNKLWLTQGLFGVVTRSLFGVRDGGVGAVPPPVDDIRGEFFFDDDLEDEANFWE